MILFPPDWVYVSSKSSIYVTSANQQGRITLSLRVLSVARTLLSFLYYTLYRFGYEKMVERK